DGPAAAGAGEQPQIQGGFEASDPSAHRGVVDAELLGRTDQGAGLGEDVEVPHIFRVDSHAGTSSGLGLRLYPDRSGDRKSTRLNSSHVSISYAVFCLKTKIDEI